MKKITLETLDEKLNKIIKLLESISGSQSNQKVGYSSSVKDGIITIIDEGTLKTSELIIEMKNKFNVYCRYSDTQLDEDFPPVKTERKFKYAQEADEENKNKSANSLNQLKQITLRERLIFELEYFKREGKHLDIDAWTLCAGSCYGDGDVPDVDWDSDFREVCVYWCSPDCADDDLRSRSAVS